MLFRSLNKSKSNRVGAETEDVVWKDIRDGVGTGHGAGDGTPSGSNRVEPLIFNLLYLFI